MALKSFCVLASLFMLYNFQLEKFKSRILSSYHVKGVHGTNALRFSIRGLHDDSALDFSVI